MPESKVLIPLDGSRFSRQILPHVQSCLHPDDTNLILMRVSDQPAEEITKPPRDDERPDADEAPLRQPYGPPGARPQPEIQEELDEPERVPAREFYDTQIEETVRQDLEVNLREEGRPLRDAGFAVEEVVRFGKPADEIVLFVEDEGVDLIAMTTHGRSGLSKLIAGSVAEEVMRNVDVPVLVFRPAQEDQD